MDEEKGNTRRWEDLPIRRDRSPNELNDVLQLFEAGLHLNHSMNNSDPELFRTEFGNINGGGSPTSFSSPILGMKNPKLSGALEANIGPLVTLIGELDLITYSSCEGHSIAGEFYEGYVGVVFWEQSSVQIDRLVGAAGYEGFIAYRTWLTDVEDGQKYPTVELYFPHCNLMEIDEYHERLLLATKGLRESIQQKE